MMLAREAGFVSAVSAGPGIVRSDGLTDVMALPRITWDGQRTSIRALRVIMSGLTIRKPKLSAPELAANYG
jgi:hypothetical protein